MPRFKVYEIVPCKMFYYKIIEAATEREALKLAQESYSDIDADEYKEGPGDITGDVTYEVEAIP